MTNLLLVCAGGAIGAGARYLVGVLALQLLGPAFPWGTLAVNIIGSFVMGLLAHWLIAWPGAPVAARLLIMTGLLGGFTTFSAYALDVVALVERGNWLGAIVYAAVSVGGAIAAVVAGLALARALSPAAV